MGTSILPLLAVISVLSAGLPLITGEIDCSQHPPHVNPKTCCPVPNLISDEIAEKCRESTNMPPPPQSNEMSGERHHHHHKHHGPHHHPCFPSCVLNETGILIDGQLDEGNLDTYLNDNLGDSPDMIPVLKESFQECFAKAEEIMEKMRQHFENDKNGPPKHGHGPPHGHCHPKAAIIMGCSMMKAFKECPDSIWSGTDECNELRNFMNECTHPHEKDDDDEV